MLLKKIKDGLRKKLQAIRASGKLYAILGYIFDETWTEPHFEDMVFVDGCVLGQHEGDVGLDHFVGTESALFLNLRGAAEVAGLSLPEQHYLYLEALRRIRRV